MAQSVGSSPPAPEQYKCSWWWRTRSHSGENRLISSFETFTCCYTVKRTHTRFRMAAPRLALTVFVLMLAVIALTEGKEELDNNALNQCVRKVEKCNVRICRIDQCVVEVNLPAVTVKTVMSYIQLISILYTVTNGSYDYVWCERGRSQLFFSGHIFIVCSRKPHLQQQQQAALVNLLFTCPTAKQTGTVWVDQNRAKAWGRNYDSE